jgi:MFS family permease
MDNLIVVGITCLLSGVVVSSWLAVRTGGGTIAFAIIYGFISGGLVSLPPATVAGLSKNQKEYSTRMGMAFTICSFGALVGNPIAGALLRTAQNAGSKQPFLRPWLFAGGTMVFAAVLTMGAYYFHNRTDERSSNSGHDGSPDRRRRSRWLQSLANEALTMQGTAFAL